ncbi:hypothetical protein JKP88DRAFT_349102 [Tribonema minus]|uniref:Uncharacterized protein n=1 Tax=Tribonema minus TaxID=303371 RepID=A0A835Z3Y4_9STRA|nr:hypothetical protein JKP88DRAFT_349102 [Tribonema minus]
MGAAASLTEEQQLVVYNKMKTYLESKDVDDMPDAQRQLYEELRLKYKHFASDVKRVPKSSKVSVPLADIQRVRPWHFVEPGDAVECRPDGQAMWFAGSVTACNEDNDTYTVLMDGDESPETLKGDQIRKEDESNETWMVVQFPKWERPLQQGHKAWAWEGGGDAKAVLAYLNMAGDCELFESLLFLSSDSRGGGGRRGPTGSGGGSSNALTPESRAFDMASRIINNALARLPASILPSTLPEETQ